MEVQRFALRMKTCLQPSAHVSLAAAAVGTRSPFVEAHAIQVVGYDNDQGYWLAKNSWGTGFADRGLFKVEFGAAGVCSDSYGLKFTSQQGPRKPTGKFSASASRPACFQYKATQYDYVSKMASLFAVDPQQILLDNLDTITEPDMSLGGLSITICGAQGVLTD
jgi:hypothetical protein